MIEQYSRSISRQKDASVEWMSEFKAELEATNYEMYKIEQATGIKLLPYIIETDGYQEAMDGMFGDFYTAENSNASYNSYKYSELNLKYCIMRVRQARANMLAVFEARQKYISALQAVWERAKTKIHEPCIEVRFGLYRTESTIPVLFLARHQIYFLENSFVGRFIIYSQEGECLNLRIPYSKDSELVFDDYLSFLIWKIEGSLKNDDSSGSSWWNPNTCCTRFLSWERSTFAL